MILKSIIKFFRIPIYCIISSLLKLNLKDQSCILFSAFIFTTIKDLHVILSDCSCFGCHSIFVEFMNCTAGEILSKFQLWHIKLFLFNHQAVQCCRSRIKNINIVINDVEAKIV